jgi:hypothetical protein
MLIDKDALQAVDNHWAVLAVGIAKRNRALEVAKVKLVRSAVCRQITLAFDDGPQDQELLERVAMAYDVAAIEGLEALLHPGPDSKSKDLQRQAQAAAWRAFDLRRPLDIPTIEEQRFFHVLHLAGLAYCGDRWSDLRQWINDHANEVGPPSVTAIPWDRRVLHQLYECWVRLLRKRSWDDLDQVRQIVAELRQDQQQYEQGVLSNGSVAQDRAMAMRLIALYHWAKATELLSVYMIQGTPPSVAVELDKHFESAGQAAAGARDAPLETVRGSSRIASEKSLIAISAVFASVGPVITSVSSRTR